MNLIALTNTSDLRLRISEVRLTFEPKETLMVYPATVQHPAVRKYIGGYLKQETQVTLNKVEPKAPETASVERVATVVQPIAEESVAAPVETTETTEVESEVPANEGESGDLRASFLAVPGITAANVDQIMEVFPTPSDLSTADRDMLLECGVSKNQVSRVLAWANQD
jgi:hypothetical protein